MQIPDTEEELRKKRTFLLLFTRELIYHSDEEIFKLQALLKTRKKPLEIKPIEKAKVPELKKTPVKKEPEEPLMKSILSERPRPPITEKKESGIATVKPIPITPQRREIHNPPAPENYKVLNIPEPRLPPEFRYLRPVPNIREIDLGKLNPLINDRAVETIECTGPDKAITVSGRMGTKPTEIILDNAEVEDIILRFSKMSRIPADIGLFKVVVGHLVFSAVISDVVPSRFLIRKMYIPRNMLPQRPTAPVRMDYSNYLKK